MSTRTLDTIAPARRWRDAADRYGRISRLYQRALAALMTVMLLSGLARAYAPLADAVSGLARDRHRALGVIVLALGLWRVGWRLVHGLPKNGAAGPAWQVLAAKAAPRALLATIALMPLSGVLMTLLAGRPIAVGPLTIPGAPEVEWLAGLAREVHGVGGLALAGFAALHVAAALKHHLFDRDSTLGRMEVRSVPADRL